MGVFTKSVFVLLFAISIPLVYRQFASQDTVKFMNSYYSNYNSVDRFLRQSANHIDLASTRMKAELGKMASALQGPYEKVRDSIRTYNYMGIIDYVKGPTAGKTTEKPKETTTVPEQPSYKMSSCPGEQNPVRLWTLDELAKFNGQSGETEIYIGFLGLVYNVTSSAQHYGPKSDYSAFAGRDATKAFVTGNFTHDLTDDIREIDESMYSHIESWASFYGSSYPVLGRLIGSYFDAKGCGTQELARVYQVFQKLADIKESQERQNNVLPDCNSEWNGDLKKGKVWCSNKSGGVERDWIGVPRISADENQTQRCVCLNLDSPNAKELSQSLYEYTNCAPNASECEIVQ